MDKVQITITTDKPVKIRVTPDEASVAAGREAEGLKRLLGVIKEDGGNVANSKKD